MPQLSATRLAAAAKGQFYPTPLEVIDLIVATVPMGIENPNILDPSCGEGIAVARLAELYGGVSWGNELERLRYTAAKKLLDNCTMGPQESLLTTGRADVLFINPPYDIDVEGKRFEVEHTRQAADWTRTNGVMIAVVPQHILGRPDWWNMWGDLFKDTHVFSFPGESFESFSQHIVIGIKREYSRRSYGQGPAALAARYKADKADPLTGERIPELRCDTTKQSYYSHPNLTEMVNSMPTIGEVIADLEEMPSLFELPEFQQATVPPQAAGGGRPAGAVRGTQVVQCAAAGMMDGQPVTIDGEVFLMSGSSYKYIIKTTKETPSADGKRTSREVIKTEKAAYQIMGLNLETGKFFMVDSQQQEEYQAFIKDHVQELIDAANASNPPMYDQDYSEYVEYFNMMHSPRKIPGWVDGALTAQKHTAATGLTVFKHSSAFILDGEMGTGKTMVALMTMAIQSGMMDGKPAKIVVLSPAVVAPKWVEESLAILSEAKTVVQNADGTETTYPLRAEVCGRKTKRKHAVPLNGDKGRRIFQPDYEPPFVHESLQVTSTSIKKPILDAQELMEYEGPAVLIMTYETAKNSALWTHAVRSRYKEMEWTEAVRVKVNTWSKDMVTRHIEKKEDVECFYCFQCGEDLVDPESGKPWTKAVEFIPGDHPNATQRKKRAKQVCPFCAAQLWQQVPFKYGGRYALAEYISQNYGGQYHLVVDEVHNAKGGDTDVGLASADLIFGAAKTIAMTGTIFNGLARSLFFILYRMSKQFRQIYEHNDATLFVSHHGFLETIIKTSAKTTGYSGYGRETLYTREAPGATPSMVAMLMPFTAFLTLDDLGMELPPLNEFVVPVAVSESMRTGMTDLDNLEAEAKMLMAISEGRNKALHSRWFNAALGWPDHPIEEHIRKGDDAEAYLINGAGTDELPKDRKLLNLVYENLEQDRGVAVFFEQVNRRNAMPRIQRLLELEGVYSAVLTVKVKPEDRIPWIRKHIKIARKKGQELVLLANGNLVKEGVDLLEFPTIIEVGQHYIVTELMQRLRRSWRLGQTKEVRLYYLYYEETLQAKALVRIARKMQAAKQVDGQVAGGLAAHESENDFVQDLMKAAEATEGDKIARLMQVRVVEDRAAPKFATPTPPPALSPKAMETLGKGTQLSLF